MKKVLATLFLVLGVSASFAQTTSNVVRWQNISGVITALNVDNPVSPVDADGTPVAPIIHSGTFPWRTNSGRATINLETGAVSFNVQGLVINGARFSGTPGPITEVTGTLVCNTGVLNMQSTHNTGAVPLSAQGDAQFSGHFGQLGQCGNPVFLIRIFNPAGARGRWIATGVERTFSEE